MNKPPINANAQFFQLPILFQKLERAARVTEMIANLLRKRERDQLQSRAPFKDRRKRIPGRLNGPSERRRKNQLYSGVIGKLFSKGPALLLSIIR